MEILKILSQSILQKMRMLVLKRTLNNHLIKKSCCSSWTLSVISEEIRNRGGITLAETLSAGIKRAMEKKWDRMKDGQTSGIL